MAPLPAIFVVIAAICSCIGCIQIYGFYRFRSLRHLVVVQKRYPIMVQIECIACILSLFIGVPSLTNVELHDPKYGLSPAAQTALTLLPRTVIHKKPMYLLRGNLVTDPLADTALEQPRTQPKCTCTFCFSRYIQHEFSPSYRRYRSL